MPTIKVQQALTVMPALTIKGEIVASDSPTTILGYDVHPAAALMPEPTPDEFERLVADIEKNGIQESVKLLKAGVSGDVILDGRSRVRVWERLGRPRESLPVKRVIPDDPTAYVLSLNVSRRHLRPDQIAAIYLAANSMTIAEQKAKAATAQAAGLKRGKKSCERTDARTGKTAAKIAKATGVSTRTVEKVQKVRLVAPERLAEVVKGTTSANMVLKAAEADHARAVEHVREDLVKPIDAPQPPADQDGDQDRKTASAVHGKTAQRESPAALRRGLRRDVAYIKRQLGEVLTSRLNGKLKILAANGHHVPQDALQDIVDRLATVAGWAREHETVLTAKLKSAVTLAVKPGATAHSVSRRP